MLLYTCNQKGYQKKRKKKAARNTGDQTNMLRAHHPEAVTTLYTAPKRNHKGENKMLNNQIKNQVNYEVIEDNGGGLYLAVFDNKGACVYLHDGYEYVPGQLTADVKAIVNGANPSVDDWDGNAEDPQYAYDAITSYQYGWAIVADNTSIYPDHMGGAAQAEFGVQVEW